MPVLFIGLFAQHSYSALIVAGFFLGIGGTSFAVGVPFVNAWFPPERRGLAVGVFGAGMVGTAISALTTVKLYDWDWPDPDDHLGTVTVLATQAGLGNRIAWFNLDGALYKLTYRVV